VAVARRKTEPLWPKVIEVAKGLMDKTKRPRLLRRFVAFHSMWFLAGTAFSVLLAIGEVSTSDLGEAWGQFGRWWLGVPFVVALVPTAFVVFVLVIEAATFVMVLPFVVLGALLGRWGPKLGLAAVIAGAVLYVVVIGRAIGEETLLKHETPEPPAAVQAATPAPVAPAPAPLTPVAPAPGPPTPAGMPRLLLKS
jgi:hypothetical protein